MTGKSHVSNVMSAFTADIKSLQEVTCKLNSLLFGRELVAAPVVGVATHQGASLESCKFDSTIHLTGQPVEKAFFIVLNGAILKDKRATLEAIAHNLLHLVQLRYGVVPSKSHGGFRELASRFGMTASLVNKNVGYADVRFTSEKWQEIKPHFEKVEFQTFVQTSGKTGEKKPAKKEKFTYIHPNGVDTVVSENGSLELFSPVGKGEMKAWKLADKADLQAIAARKREQRRKYPSPESRGKVIK